MLKTLFIICWVISFIFWCFGIIGAYKPITEKQKRATAAERLLAMYIPLSFILFFCILIQMC